MRRLALGLLMFGCEPKTTETRNVPPPQYVTPSPRAEQRAEEEEQRIAEAKKHDESDRALHLQIAADEVQRQHDIAQQHRDECAATYRKRFTDLQKVAAEYTKLKPEMTRRCKELAKSCTTFSDGRSVCHGLTGQEKSAFDQFCGAIPFQIVVPMNEACADVDPEHLTFDFSWDTEAARAFSKRSPPP